MTNVEIDKNKLIIEGRTIDADFSVEDINITFANDKRKYMDEAYLKVVFGDYVKLSALLGLFEWINENSGENWRLTLEKLDGDNDYYE